MNRFVYPAATTFVAFSCTPSTLQGLMPWLVAIGSLTVAAAADNTSKSGFGGVVLGGGLAIAAADFLSLLS